MPQERRAVWMEGSTVCLIDQRLLPHRLSILESGSYPDTIAAIRDMALRGAGTIGVAGGFAMAQAVLGASESGFLQQVEQAARQISAARPTARNLSYAVERVLAAVGRAADIQTARTLAVNEARAIYDEDSKATLAIARAGLCLLPSGKAVLTHCNAGWLAYPGWGTALGPIYLAHQQGRSVFVYVPETRPRGQGAKLTSWELTQAKIPHALIADTAAGYTMGKGEIGLVMVGADRIALNADTANKIGTYTLAVLAARHRIPFYVAAPSPTFDPQCPSGDQIPIEERAGEEVIQVSGSSAQGGQTTVRVAPAGVTARNPAFDVTPAELITGFVTESGIVAPDPESIARFLAGRGALNPTGTLQG